MKGLASSLLLVAIALPALAEQPTRFERAQQLAWDGRRDRARSLCEEILAESPKHHDARVLMARTHAWDGEYDQARQHLQFVVVEKPDYLDAYRALADTEMWDDDDARALVVLEQGLSIAPQDLELRYRQVQALEGLERYLEAHAVAVELVESFPDDPRIPRIEYRVRVKSLRWAATLGYRYEEFERFGEPWQEWSTSIKRQQRWGSAFVRLRHARRFGDTGEQIELDAYPKLPLRQYLYLNVGFGEEPFPDLRAGAELFKNFAEGWEGSLGARYLDFGSSDVVVYTGSISKYIADYWISLRPVVTEKELGLSSSWALSLRRYVGAETWIGSTIGFGSKPDLGIDVGGDGPGEVQLTSSRLSVAGQYRINDLWRLKADVGFREKDESVTSSNSSVSGSLSVTRAF